MLLAGQRVAANHPNVVLIMTDNHGAWTLGCYGNQDIRTPNIDRLARDGTLMTRAFASNPVCSPTRATFLTGLLPSQHGVHCFLTGGGLQTGPEARCTLDQITSLPEVLKEAGYACGLVGKWHLGGNLQSQEGFDDYWITMPHGGTSTFYDAQVIENGTIRQEPQYLTDFWTEHAVKFIDQQAGSEKPFFLFLAYNGPYSLSRLLLRDGRNRHAAYYADQELPSFPREPTHPWQFSNRDFSNNPTSIRRVATEISGIDDGVGTVMSTLQRHGLDENTIVVFVADQGWVGGQGGFFGMGDHTRPVTARDGMMHIPMIWHFPKRIPAGVRSDRMVTNYDFMPTLLGVLGLEANMPQQPRSPGQDFSLLLTSGNDVSATAKDSNKPVFYEFEGLRCIRTEEWKYIHRHPNGPHELYCLADDPSEFNNLISSSEHSAIRARLKRELDAFFDEYAEPKYDLWHGGGSQARLFVGVEEELAQSESFEPPPLSSGFQPAKLGVPPGFTVELAAGPPLVEHPTFATLDEQGRLFLSENAGVNMTAAELEENLPNSIRMLVDLDHDGRFDTSTVFADKMTFPMGGAWHDGALYVASPPNIWRLEDTDGDGVADQRKILVDSFGYTGNAASIHGPVGGPDGRLYWCDGYHGHELRDEAGNILSQREGSYLFSCKPDGSDVRLYCGGGMDNPVEVDFTDAGQVLGTVNIMYTRPRVDCFVHWLYGGVYPHRERILEETKSTGPFLGPVHRFGHVAISGTTRYRSGTMDHRWRDNFFATFFNSGKVVRLELEPDGSTFAAVQREFLTAQSREFHPTDVVEDADGSLLVVDTGGWFYRGCPTSQFAKPDVLGGIYRIRRDGMTPQVDPRGLRLDWPALTHDQLVALLGDTRHAVRERAIAECASRGEAIVADLSRAVATRDILYRIGGLWALTRIVGESHSAAARGGIRTGLEDSEPTVRLTACRSLATYPDPQALGLLQQLLAQDSAEVRREAATAIGRIGNPEAVESLLSGLSSVEDRSEEHALVYALIEIASPLATKQGLKALSANVRRGALIALDQMDGDNLSPDEVLPFLLDGDAALRQAAAGVLVRHADWLDRVAPALEALWVEAPQPSDLIALLIQHSLDREEVAALVAQRLFRETASKEEQLRLLAAISSSMGPAASELWVAPIRRLLRSDDQELSQATLAALSALDYRQFTDDLSRFASDENRPKLLRAAARQLASGSRSSRDDASLDLLVDVLESGTPAERLLAAQSIASVSLAKHQLIRLAPHLTRAAPAALRELLRPYERAVDLEVGRQFLEAMENARGLTQLSPPEFSDVIKRYPAELLPQANRLLDRIVLESEKKLAKLDQLWPLLSAGDAAHGRELFFAEKSKCSSCHRAGEIGGKIGPDLTTIGSNRTAKDLLESVVFPSATIVRDYESNSVVTVNGNVYTGMIAKETADTLYLQQQAGEPIAIARADIEQMAPSPTSIMPSGLDDALSDQELADVVAFLKTLRSE